MDGSAVTQIHACCPGPSSRALQRCPGHCCNSRLTNRGARNRCRVHTDWQIELIVFIHYIRMLSSVTMPTCDVLLRHFRKMLLRVRIRGFTLSSLIYSWLGLLHFQIYFLSFSNSCPSIIIITDIVEAHSCVDNTMIRDS